MGLSMSKDVLYNTFINRVRDNLHIILCMSPVGEAFRSRCRQFPSLINCCTIDWYMEWPAEALQLSVDAVFVPDGARRQRRRFRKIGRSATCASTSTSPSRRLPLSSTRSSGANSTPRPSRYLELIALYTSLLAEKRDELGTARDRLLNGLLKLDETNEVVENMQEELGELQPELKEKSAATEVLLVQVAKDKEEAAVVEEKVSAEEATAKARRRKRRRRSPTRRRRIWTRRCPRWRRRWRRSTR